MAGSQAKGNTVVIGYNALATGAGSNGVYIGLGAGQQNTTGASYLTGVTTVCIGRNSKPTEGSNNEIIIGDNAKGRGSQTVTLGRDDIIVDGYINGNWHVENGYVIADELRLAQMNTPPATSADPGR